MFENPNPIDALNCLVRSENELKKGNYLGAAQAALEASQRLIACKERQDENMRQAMQVALGCNKKHD